MGGNGEEKEVKGKVEGEGREGWVDELPLFIIYILRFTH